MPKLRANGIELEMDSFGEADAEPLLLIMGLGAQMILWDEAFCEGLAGRGFRVIRFDNRDVGLSTWFEGHLAPSPARLARALAAGEPLDVPYRLSDMADDAAQLLAALRIQRAHVVGTSMGGMIAQTLALRHRARVRTLTSLMSTTGHPSLPMATPEAMRVLMTPLPTDRAGYVARTVANARVIGSPGFPFDEARVRERASRSYDRGFNPQGVARQLAAILASGSRREALASLDVPTLVIHGSADPLVPAEGGKDTAEAIPGAELLILEGMGHDLPPPLWGRIQDAIAALARRCQD